MHAESRKGLNSTFSILHTAPNLNKIPSIHTHTLSSMIIQCFSSCGVRAVVSLGVVHGWETVQIVIGGQTAVDWCLPLCKTEGAEMCRCGFFFFSCSNPGDSHWLQHVHSATYLPHFLLLPSLYLYLNVLCGSEYRDWSQFWFVVLVAHRKLYPTQATSLTLPFYKKNPNPFCLSPIGPLWSHVLQWRQFHSAFFSLLYNQVLWHSLLALILCTFTWQVKMDVFLCNM